MWVFFALLDPDPDSEYGSGSTDPIEYGSNTDPDPDPQPCRKSKKALKTLYIQLNVTQLQKNGGDRTVPYIMNHFNPILTHCFRTTQLPGYGTPSLILK